MADVSVKYCPTFAQLKGKDASGVITAIASTASIDRDGETIAPKAFEKSLPGFLAGGAILATHLHRLSDGSPPMIGYPVAAEYKKGNLEIAFKMGKGELAQKWATAYEDGTWRNVSVGFLPSVGAMKTVGDKQVYEHQEAELLELSAVPVGSNRDARLRDFDPQDILGRLTALEQMIKQLREGMGEHSEQLLERIKAYMDDLAVPGAEEYADELLGNPHRRDVADEQGVTKYVERYRKQSPVFTQ